MRAGVAVDPEDLGHVGVDIGAVVHVVRGAPAGRRQHAADVAVPATGPVRNPPVVADLNGFADALHVTSQLPFLEHVGAWPFGVLMVRRVTRVSSTLRTYCGVAL